MNDFLTHSAYISVFISLIAFYLGSKLFLKFHFPLFNPLLIAVLLVIGFLKVTGMDYKDYNEGASYINYLLTPSTICLAVPLYEQIKLLKKNYKAIFLGILSGVVTGLFAVYVLCLAFLRDAASQVHHHGHRHGTFRRARRLRLHHRRRHHRDRDPRKYHRRIRLPSLPYHRPHRPRHRSWHCGTRDGYDKSHGAWPHRGCHVLSLHRSRRCFHSRLRLLLCHFDLAFPGIRDW